MTTLFRTSMGRLMTPRSDKVEILRRTQHVGRKSGAIDYALEAIAWKCFLKSDTVPSLHRSCCVMSPTSK